MDSLATLNFEFDNFNEQKVFINYKLYPETFSKKMGGDFQKSPDEIPIEIKKNGLNKIIFLRSQIKKVPTGFLHLSIMKMVSPQWPIFHF